MEHTLILLVLLGLSQAFPSTVHSGSENNEPETHVDITTGILGANNGTEEFLVDGDILLPRKRNAMACYSSTFSCRWEKSDDGLVEVPYTISSRYSPSHRKLIEDSFEDFHSQTCIRFVPRVAETYYIAISSGWGCYSIIGRLGDKQPLSLASWGCMEQGIVQHELLHALGFHHEQSRSDRDQYVKINWPNVSRTGATNFRKKETNNLNTPYDYSSIMHYSRNAFARVLALDTITPTPDPTVPIGQRQRMSEIDILKVNRLYECSTSL